MEFIAAFVPPMVPALVLSFRTHFRARELADLLRARYPEVLEQARGRPRRWYDGLLGDELEWKPFRKQVIRVAQERAASDLALADVLARLARAQRWEDRAWVAGLVVVVAVYVALRVALA